MLIDDEAELLRITGDFLNAKGFCAESAQTTVQALAALERREFDCIVLDVMLEEENGFELCRRIRALTQTPIIFLSNLSEEEYQKKGFLSGGDDYVSKPCNLEILDLRIGARVKNRSAGGVKRLDFPPLTIDLLQRTVTVNQTPVTLTTTEFDILVLLASNEGKIFSIADIFRRIWKQEDLNQAQTVQMHMSRLRRKLESAYDKHYYIETVWKKGYQFLGKGRDSCLTEDA